MPQLAMFPTVQSSCLTVRTWPDTCLACANGVRGLGSVLPWTSGSNGSKPARVATLPRRCNQVGYQLRNTSTWGYRGIPKSLFLSGIEYRCAPGYAGLAQISCHLQGGKVTTKFWTLSLSLCVFPSPSLSLSLSLYIYIHIDICV